MEGRKKRGRERRKEKLTQESKKEKFEGRNSERLKT
jgi:hypothetical protein